DVYSSEQLAEAEIARFYREKGKRSWIPFTQFSAEKNKIYQFRYSVSFDGHYRETVFERFVHANAHTIDFEYEPAAIKGNAVFYSDVGGSYMDERFLFDGGYYNLKSTGSLTDVCVSADWSMSGNASYKIHHNIYGWGGFHVAKEMTKEPINAVRFWANAVVGQETQISLQCSQGWVYTPAFELQAGVHQYTLYLERSDVVSVSSFTMLMIGGSTVYLDDVELLYIDNLSLATPEYSNVFAIADPIELAKPALRSDLFTPTELDGALWTCTYSVDGGEEKTLAPDGEGKYYLALDKGGKVRVEWTASFGGYTAAASAEFTAGIVPFTVPITGGRLGEEIAIAAPYIDEEMIDISKIQVTVSYRFGEGDWVPTEVGAPLVLGKVGTVEFKYEIAYAYTETLTLYGEETYKIIVPEKDVIWSFEDSDPWFGARPYDFGRPNVHSLIEEKEDGSHWLALHSFPEMDSWLGIGSAGSAANGDGVALEGEASTLIFTLTTDRDYSALQFWFVTDGSPKGEYHTAVIRRGENRIQFTMDQPFSVIHTFAVEMKRGVPAVYIDDIRTGFSFEVAPPAEPAPLGQKYTVTIPDLTHLDGATLAVYQRFGEGEWAEILPENGVYAFTPDTEGVYQIRYLVTVGEITIERKVALAAASGLYLQPITLDAMRQGVASELPLPAVITQDGAAVTWKVEYSFDGETYTEIPASDGKYLFTPAEAERYIIRYTASAVVHGVSIQKSVTATAIAKGRNMVADFEDGDKSYIDFKMTSGGIIEQDGSMWLRAVSGAGDWIYLNDLDFSIGAPMDTLILRLQSTGAVTAGGSGIIYVYTDQGNFFAESVRNEGDIYTFTFARAFNKLTCFSVGVDAGVTIKIDYILAAAAEENPFVVTDPVLADGVLGEEYAVALPGVPEGAAGVNYAVRYRLKGTEDWEEIVPVESIYKFTPRATGAYEISFVVTGMMEGKEYDYHTTLEIQVTASFALGTVTLAAAKQGERCEIALPSLVVPNGVAVTWKVEISPDGAAYTEISASEGKYFFTPQSAGSYVVRYTVTPGAGSGLQPIEQTATLQVRDRLLLEDF
ncbi:MAG: hypothetical protein K2H43_06370, partial [Clostridia bacterium]|nr:hypothetical protein [Clostridia bacterium]